ncbi:MAG TPA: dihydroneopterin aldolase [Longimicrobiales bacterium]|nr:dihydroneopterin aldolase [Longimicrobiales bacterium]
MDRLLVPELRLQARVGVGEEERARAQRVVLGIELHLDLSRAGTSDDLRDTVDYEAVCELADQIVRARPFELIEAIAEEVAAALLERFDVAEARVRVRKPGALARWGVPYAEVEVRRRRDG